MLTLVFALCIAMVLYGVVRFAVAKWRLQPNPAVHILWVPAASILYAVAVAATVLVSMA